MNEPKILVLMLSCTADKHIRDMTNQALNTMFDNMGSYLKENAEMRCVLVETNSDSPPYTQDNVNTFYPNEPEFRYNRFLNLGYDHARLIWPEFFAKEPFWNDQKYVVIANNDLYFHENWASELIDAIEESELDSASPKSPGWQFHHSYNDGIHKGWGIGHQFCGWLQMYRYNSFAKLSPLDESFSFWCADNDMTLEMQRLEMDHALVSSSLVTHFTSASHRLIPNGKHHEWTQGMCDILGKKIAEGKYNKDEL